MPLDRTPPPCASVGEFLTRIDRFVPHWRLRSYEGAFVIRGLHDVRDVVNAPSWLFRDEIHLAPEISLDYIYHHATCMLHQSEHENEKSD